MFQSCVLVLLCICSVWGQNEVSFSVGMTQHQRVGGGQVVTYDMVFNNQAAAYDTTTGKFTAPQTGIYVFQVHSLARSDADMWLELMHNSQYVMSLWGHTDNDYAAAGNSVVLTLNKGDQVYVTSVEGYTSNLYGTPTEIYTTFSGYLISPVFQELPGIGHGK